MVSVGVYLQVFLETMPKRLQELRQLYEKKAKIDREVLQNNGLSNDSLQLLDILGKDSWFRKAEKRKGKTLRHELYKIRKSIDFFLKNKIKLEDVLESLPVEYKALTLQIYEKLRVYDEALSHELKLLEDVYENQSKCLEANDFLTYAALLKRESSFIKNIKGLGTEFDAFQRTFSQQFAQLLKRKEVPIVVKTGLIGVGMVAYYTGAVFAAYFYTDVFAVESDSFLGSLYRAMIFATAFMMRKALVDESLKEPIKNLNLFIRDWAQLNAVR